ncbi:MAG: hypothetical protein GY862_16965, partial [Gammaproteobacteria bacterium]|nr:hypothetical protein [Gammaproteobacteria bacterium]
NCCHKIEQQVKPHVGSPARCFITLWANANAEPLVEKDVSRKCLLQVPESLNMDDLRLWLNKRFKNDKDMFNQLMNTVTCQNGEICAVYRSLRGSVQAVRR